MQGRSREKDSCLDTMYMHGPKEIGRKERNLEMWVRDIYMFENNSDRERASTYALSCNVQAGAMVKPRGSDKARLEHANYKTKLKIIKCELAKKNKSVKRWKQG